MYASGERVSEFEREELYGRVWDKPILQIAEDMEISGTVLKKRCKKLGIPTPERGRWAKIEAGKPVQPRKDLVPINRELSERIYGYAIKWKDTSSWSDDELVSGVPFHILSAESIELVERFTGELMIEGQLRNPTEWIRGLSAKADTERERDRELVRSPGYFYAYQRLQDNRLTEKSYYPFQVSKGAVKRALRILDSLDKELFEIEGVILENEPFYDRNNKIHRSISIRLLGSMFGLDIVESQSIFTLRFSSGEGDSFISISDQGDTNVEAQIGNALLKLCKQANAQKGEDLLEERKWARERLRKEKESRIAGWRKARKNLRDALNELYSEWERSENLRRIAATIGSHADDESNEKRASALREMSYWAIDEAEMEDPFADDKRANGSSALELANRIIKFNDSPCWEFSDYYHRW